MILQTEIQTRNISRFLEMSDVSQIINRSFHRVIASQKNYSFSSLRRNIAKPFLKRNVLIETKLFLIDKTTIKTASYPTKLLILGISWDYYCNKFHFWKCHSTVFDKNSSWAPIRRSTYLTTSHNMHICKLDTPYICPITSGTASKYFPFTCDIIQNLSNFASK